MRWTTLFVMNIVVWELTRQGFRKLLTRKEDVVTGSLFKSLKLLNIFHIKELDLIPMMKFAGKFIQKLGFPWGNLVTLCLPRSLIPQDR